MRNGSSLKNIFSADVLEMSIDFTSSVVVSGFLGA
jgi:hypothetical protein